MSNLKNKLEAIASRPVFNLGFRIFFLSASIYAIVSMLQWLMVYSLKIQAFPHYVPQFWHGHEMIFGYVFAVIAGFLLTAVQNWTGIPMPSGKRLFIIWAFWLTARICALFDYLMYLTPLLNFAFIFLLAWTVTNACRQVEGQAKRQAGIIAKLWMLTAMEALVAFAILGNKPLLLQNILYLTVLLVVGLDLTIGRRVIPFFTQNGLRMHGINFEPKNSDKLDKWCLITFLIFFVTMFFRHQIWAQPLINLSAFVTAVLNTKRLFAWYNHAIWRFPLLWTLFIAFLGVCIGLFLFALQALTLSISASLAIHAMALSGMGMLIISMMARVSLGHSGRNIHEPPIGLNLVFYSMVLVFIFRVIMPIIVPQKFIIWIIHAQIAWIISFAIFTFIYFPIWTKPRVDGRQG